MKYNLSIVLLLTSLSHFSQTTIQVPSPTGGDDTSIIMTAINAAGSGDVVQFQAGTYKLETTPNVAYAHIYISSKHNLTLKGASPSGGVPTTKIVRILDLPTTLMEQPAPIYVRSCNNFTLKDISFNNDSPHATAGKVTEIGSDYFKVEIFSDLPMVNNTKFTAGNVWDIDKNLKKVGSLSYSSSIGTVTVDDAINRIMKVSLTNTSTLSLINVNEYVSWHYGTPSRPMIYIRGGSNITLDNTDIYNTLRSAIFIAYSENIIVRNVDIKPIGNHLATSPRDGIHSSRIKGSYLVEDCNIEGTRLDAFVALGTFAKVKAVINTKKIQIETDQILDGGFNYNNIEPINFIDQNGEKISINVLSSTRLSNSVGSVYEINTVTDIPSFVTINTTVIPNGLSTTSLITKNNTYNNIAGASELLYTNNATSENNSHSNIMYPAVRLGANATKGHTGNNYTIKNSTFIDCAWENHGLAYNLQGYIAVDNNSDDYSNAFINDIDITGNTFISNFSITNYAAIELKKVYDINIDDNIFSGFNEPIKFDPILTRDLNISNNTFDNNSVLTKKVNIAKDAFLKGGIYEHNNYGTYTFAETKYSTNSNYSRITFLNYDLPNIPNNVTDAQLYLYSQGTNSVTARQNIKGSSNNSWGETSITYNNKPSYSYISGYAGLDIDANYTGWTNKNINSIINNRPTSSAITLVLEESSSTSSLATFYTKEADFRGESFLLIKHLVSGNQSKSLDVVKEVVLNTTPKSKIFPNPITNKNPILNVIYTNGDALSYEIFSLKGALVLKDTIKRPLLESNNAFTVNLNRLVKGIYIIKLNFENRTEAIKFLKE